MNTHYNLDSAGKKIRRWQREAGLKGLQIARSTGISAAYYSDIAKGKKRGSIEVLAKIVGQLGHTLEDLLDPESQQPPPKGKSGGKYLRPVNTTELKQKLEPLLGKQTDDFLGCYQLWIRAPRDLKNVLKSFADSSEEGED